MMPMVLMYYYNYKLKTMLHCIQDTPSPVSNWIMQLRDVNIQKDSARFRNNIRRISHVLAYEIGKTLNYRQIDVTTPLGTAKSDVVSDQIVIASILRAALPMHDGFLDVFDDAENAFLSAYRSYKDDGSFEIKAEYMACPDLNGKTLLIVDPMLATGASIVTAVNCLLRDGTPKKMYFASIISSRQGVETLQKNFGEDCEIWTAACDPKINSHGYIVPGLGDAGDLCFGQKL